MRDGAGALNRRVRIERAEAVPDESGGLAERWTDVGGAWSAIRTLGARREERFDAGQGTERFEATIRHRADVGRGDRLRLAGGRLLVIRAAVDPTGERRFLRLECEAEA